MNEYQDRCPSVWEEHFWSFPDKHGTMECLWCRAKKRVQMTNVEPLREVAIPNREEDDSE